MITRIRISEPYVDVYDSEGNCGYFSTDFDAICGGELFDLSDDDIEAAYDARSGYVSDIIDRMCAKASKLATDFVKTGAQYHFATKDGWEIVERCMDNVIVRRKRGDYAVGHHYDELTGQWSHGHYPGTLEEARKSLVRCCMMDLGIREED